MSDDKKQVKCRGVLRGLQFGWNEYQGARQPQIVARFELLDGENAGSYDTWFGSLSEDMSSKGRPFAEYTWDALRHCGWTGDDLTQLPALAEAGKLARPVSLVREIKTGTDGKQKTLIKYVNGDGSKVDLKDKAMSTSDIAALAKRMRPGGSGAPVDGRDAPPLGDEDLPF